MFVIWKKEIAQFFNSMVGVIAISIFLILTALFTFLIPSTSVLDSGFANLDTFFSNGPLFFLFLIPAITMRLFSEEYNSGTIELLATKPLTSNQVVLGKYFAALTIEVLALLPTLVYFYTIYQLATPIGNIDTGGIIGSYIGLFFLAGGFTAIGLFSSALTSNQIVSFLLAVVLSFLFYMGFDFLSELPLLFGSLDYIVQRFGINAHYMSMSRGVVDTRDLLYFVSLIIIFILFTKLVYSRKK